MDAKLPQRSTRGKRMKKLMGEEIDADEQFWGQDFFREEENDGEYEAGPEEEDVVDSDFDDDETDNTADVDQEADVEKDEKAAQKRKSIYVDKRSKKPRPLSEMAESPFDAENATEKAALPKRSPGRGRGRGSSSTGGGSAGVPRRDVTRYRDSTRQLRDSTKELSKAKELEWGMRKRIIEEKKKLKPRRLQDTRPLTQEELLEEAKLTEQINTEALNQYLRAEEEKKKKSTEHSLKARVPMIRFHSKEGINTITFPDANSLRLHFPSNGMEYPAKPICTITGQPARYLDPLTRKPYATVSAFSKLRQESATA